MQKRKVWFWGEKEWECGGDGGREAERITKDEGTMSQYSLSIGLLPPLGATTIGRKVKLHRFIVSPSDPRYRMWETYLVFLVFYTAWVSPFEFGFLRKPKAPLSTVDNVVNGFFFIDIVLTFFVAFHDKATNIFVDDPKKIARKYISTWMVFDVASTVPYEVFWCILHSSIQGYGIFSMLRLWRLRRVSNLFARLEKNKKYNYFWVRCTKLLLVLLFVIHCAACFSYFIAAHYPDPSKTFMALADESFLQSPVWRRYVIALYWSITTLSSTGYGDIHAVNTREMIFITVYMVFNLGLSAYIIGNMTNLVVHVTSRTRKFRDTIQAAKGFAQRNQLPVRLQEQMVEHLCLRYRADSEGLQQEIIDALPKAIRSSISNYLFYETVDKVYLFHGVSDDLLFQLVSEMKAEYFPPKEEVILQNEAPTDFYILVNGACDIVKRVNGVEQVVAEAHAGDVVGEVWVLCYRPQSFTVRTKRLSQLLRINRTAFLNLVQANVDDGAIIMNNLLQHLKDSEDDAMKRISDDTTNVLAQGKMDLPLSLCFAAARQSNQLVEQLLKRGSNPNEIDNKGQTGLHIAAANGSKDCVDLLLKNGADPNKRDSEGSVPLWEAIRGRHEEIAQLLAAKGATITSGDVNNFLCQAVESNSLDLLKDIVKYGGAIKLENADGTTALHRAVSEGNVEMVKFLLDQGVKIDKENRKGWTAQDYAEHQGQDDIESTFQNHKVVEKELKSVPGTPEDDRKAGEPLMKISTEPLMPPRRSGEAMMSPIPERNWSGISRRRKNDDFKNSLFAVMSAANVAEDLEALGRMSMTAEIPQTYPARIIISSQERGETCCAKVVLLPNTMEELLETGRQKFGFLPTKVQTREGAEIDDIKVIRDGDHLLLSGDS